MRVLRALRYFDQVRLGLPPDCYRGAWRIGSECGPKVLEISEEVWGEKTKRFSKMLKAILRLGKLEELLATRPDLEPESGWVSVQLLGIEGGAMTDRDIMILNSRCTQIEKQSKWIRTDQ